jgi:hypothetical protein
MLDYAVCLLMNKNRLLKIGLRYRPKERICGVLVLSEHVRVVIPSVL